MMTIPTQRQLDAAVERAECLMAAMLSGEVGFPIKTAQAISSLIDAKIAAATYGMVRAEIKE